MKPSASSATDGTKPGPARVTSTPAAEAASTSMLRISTAQRTNARSFGRPAKITRRLDQAGGIQRVVGVVQHDLRKRLQAIQAALAIILAPRLWRMGQ